jgi:hypothetical protein
MPSTELAQVAPLIAAASTALEVGGDRAPETLLVARHRNPAGEPLAVVVLRGLAREGAAAVLLSDNPFDPAVRSIGDLPEFDDEPFALSELWLPYLPTADSGVVVAWTRNTEPVAALRHGPVTEDFAVAQEQLLAVLWNAKRPNLHAWLRRPGLELARQGSWWPAAELPRSLVSRDRFIEACRRHAAAWAIGSTESDRHAWAWTALCGVWSAVDKLCLVRHVLEAATLEEEPLLGALGAGPLEDMQGDWLLDQLGRDMAEDRRWLYALSMVHGFRVAGPLGERFSSMLTPDMRAWMRSQQLDL